MRKSILIGGFFVLILIVIGFLTSTFILKNLKEKKDENTSISNSEYVFGIDISHYQKEIDWSEVRTTHHPIEFVFMRATMGDDGKDKRFEENWINAKKHGYLRGAYHFYRPNENSTSQFENYASTVKLQTGDMVPILDIEWRGKLAIEDLRKGVLNWLKLAEETYGVKPIVYTSRHYYKNYLKGIIEDYPLWIASYSDKHKLEGIDWTFHQFTEHVIVNGIDGTVDGSDFNGKLSDLKKMCIK